jgi:hypothetical protein
VPTGPKVTGRVVDAAGKGIAHARVVSTPDTSTATFSLEDARKEGFPGFAATSDETGRFALAVSKDAPIHVVFAHATGYAPTAKPDVAVGADVTLVLAPPAAVVGTVRDREAKPIPGARVRLLLLLDTMRIESEARTAADGAYRLYGPPPLTGPHAWKRMAAAAYVHAVAEGFAPLFLENALAGATSAETRLDLVLSRGSVLTGRVVDAESGEPVEGARVVLTSTEGWTTLGRASGVGVASPYGPRALDETLTSKDGTYRFERVPCVGPPSLPRGRPTFGSVAAWKAGYTSTGERLPLAADGAVVEKTLRLHPAASIVGRVVRPDGSPAALATVISAGRESADAKHPELYPDAPRSWALTGDDGRFRCDGVPASRSGPTEVAVEARHASGTPPGPQVAATVHVGRTTDVGDVRLPAIVPGPTTVLVVTGPDGKPVWGASVTAPGVGTVRSDAQGHAHWVWFEGTGKVATRVDVVVRAAGFAPATVRIEAPTGRETVAVTLVPGSRLSGRVLRADGSPAHGAWVRVGDGRRDAADVFPDPGATPGGDESDEPTTAAVPSRVHATTTTNADGGFDVVDLPEGPYHVLAGARRRVPVGRAKPLRVVASGVAAGARDLVLTLPVDDSPATGRLEGRVATPDGAPLGSARVEVRRGGEVVAVAVPAGPADRPPPGVVEARIEPDGRFAFDGVPAGPATVVVFVPGFRTGEVAVDVGAETTRVLAPIGLDRGVVLAGRLRAPAGTSGKGRVLWLQPVGGSRGSALIAAAIDADGVFRATGLDAGTWRVSVPPERFSPRGEPALVPARGPLLLLREGTGEVRLDDELVAAGTVTIGPMDPRLPLSHVSPPPTEAQVAFGAATRVRVTAADGTTVLDVTGVERGGIAGNANVLHVAPGRYVARLDFPTGEAKEESLTVEAGKWVQFPRP